MVSGILNVNKPSGITSYDVVRVVKSKLNLKKVGHCGTLDPLASGVLLVCFGKSTKLFDCLSKYEKVYETEMLFGFQTDTGDTEGKIISRFNSLDGDIPSARKVQEVLSSFLGEIEQLPPMYSAVKYKGKKLYEFARRGETVERKLRKVRIYNIRLICYKYPYVKFMVEVSRGTYIRSLVEDIGKKIGICATVSGLVRKKVGPFVIEESLGFQEIKNTSYEELLGVAARYEGYDYNYRLF
jgi:tRNA pseudouridine55 synthase